MADEPIHYTIEGSPHRWLIYRTQMDEGSDRKGPLCMFVADLPADEQHPFDVISLFLNDPKLSNASRPRATAVSERGVLACVDLIDLTDGSGDVEAALEVASPGDARGKVSVNLVARVKGATPDGV